MLATHYMDKIKYFMVLNIFNNKAVKLQDTTCYSVKKWINPIDPINPVFWM